MEHGIVIELSFLGHAESAKSLTKTASPKASVNRSQPWPPLRQLRARVNRAAIAPTIPSMEHYGMHAHFTDAEAIVLFGGGIASSRVSFTVAPLTSTPAAQRKSRDD